VVNEVLQGGWLEFLTCVDFDESAFDSEHERKRDVKGAAASILQNKERERKEAAEHTAAAAAAGMEKSTEEAENRSKKGDVEKEQKQKITDMAGARKAAKQKSKEEAKQDPDKKSRREVLETEVVDQQQNRVQSTVWDTSGVAASNGVTPAFMPLQTASGAEVKEVGVVIIYCRGDLLKAGPSAPLIRSSTHSFNMCSLIFTFFHICSSRSGRFWPSFETAPGLPTGARTRKDGVHWRSTVTRADVQGSRWRAERSPKSNWANRTSPVVSPHLNMCLVEPVLRLVGPYLMLVFS
jgi:hypothetical protein